MELPPFEDDWAALTEKKNVNAFHGGELMKEHNYALQKADKPRLRSSTQNIYSVISISAVILKLINDQNHIHFRLIQVLKTGMALHFVTFRSLSNKPEFSIYPPWSCGGVEEQMLIFSCQV